MLPQKHSLKQLKNSCSRTVPLEICVFQLIPGKLKSPNNSKWLLFLPTASDISDNSFLSQLTFFYYPGDLYITRINSLSDCRSSILHTRLMSHRLIITLPLTTARSLRHTTQHLFHLPFYYISEGFRNERAPATLPNSNIAAAVS